MEEVNRDEDVTGTEEWLACEVYGHNYTNNEDGSHTCLDCGDHYQV
jgi:hypothetical protein